MSASTARKSRLPRQEPCGPAPERVELEAGNLRHIRHGAIEILRAISFIARDRDWVPMRLASA